MNIAKYSAIGLTALLATVAQAQSSERNRWEIRTTDVPLLQTGDSITKAYPFALYSKRQPEDALSPELVSSREIGSARYGNIQFYGYGGVFGIPAITVVHQNCTGKQPESPVIVDDILAGALYIVRESIVARVYTGEAKRTARNLLQKCGASTRIAE